ncbi:hypothetical protein LTR99_003770 [Exophiala xenobiotica]|uniref:Uncharacterized protein n=1 Tax=Vermiconidia calcicola TaxID=1690605 RepID=A0AAV9Q152_9PEZI|nr:hypothetical protein LTR47_008749 [Exophiala xenobiotica]KAK5531463.1 hypothetical protein LTR25_008572 [Vermiconidia calcicola]KAK5304705.1 hypothetical protein LTR99_003770 [Exophiala xenobiotica]KAK5376389.1 hypothetical protein LTS03_005157 [Exophiala xenobiotica]KAK5435238.1 hypothetical protein LTR34_002741 [Exophiala xenobiotica]
MSDRGRRVRRPVSDFIEDISEDIFEESDTGSGEEDYDPRKADSMRRAGRNDAQRKYIAPATEAITALD